MGRKKIFPAARAVNPLQRMLGTYLRMERVRLGHSSSDVAGWLGLTDTYLRLAESGRATLNQSLVFKIIEIFADSNAPTHNSRTISFSRCAVFMVGMHWLGAEMAAHNGPKPDRYGSEALASRVSDFQIFFEHTKGYFDLEDGSPEQKAYLEEIAAPAVGDFLRSEVYGIAAGAKPDEQIMQDFLRLPTLNFEVLLHLKQDLADRSFVHTADIAAKWEKRQASQFRYVRGLFKNADLIVSPDNLNDFHFQYLSEARFEEVQMIFMNAGEWRKRTSTKTAEAVTKTFERLLNEAREKAGIHPLKPDETPKIRFLCPSEEEQAQHKDKLHRLLSRSSSDRRTPTSLEAYWSFETHSNLQIGFVGVLDHNVDNTRNLNLSESLERARLFGDLWNQLNGAPNR